MPAFRNLTGNRFGRLIVVEFSHMKNGHAQWRCLCDCGNEITTSRGRLKDGGTRSCGCLRQEVARKLGQTMNKNGENNPAYRHGMRGTRFYGTWHNILSRCTKTDDKYYRNYGGRGIRVEWESFEEFKNDMYVSYLEHRKQHPEKVNTTIERIDNNGNYSKENCRWATQKEQRANQRPISDEMKAVIANKISAKMTGNTNAHGRLGRKYPTKKNEPLLDKLNGAD